jgi:superfamily II DNA helicase RecQ
LPEIFLEIMQFKIFTVPITDNGTELTELNNFLRNHKVVDCVQQFASTAQNANWCFCVRYIESYANSMFKQDKPKDYINEMDPELFEVFKTLRQIRKDIALEDKIPAYAICTDEELSNIAKLKEVNKTGLLSVKGFGEKKFEKFGRRIIERWEKINKNEKDGQPIQPNS